MTHPIITHADILSFAEKQINLPQNSVHKYRDQVNNLRDILEQHIANNPGFGLVKMLHSGSVAKGTALRTINDLDVAVYVKKDQTPGDEKEVVSWIGELLREMYPQKDPSDFDTNSRHCARINFRGSGLDVDVVPILYEGDENDYGYLIDKYTGEKLLTSIPLHLKFIRTRKASNPQHFAQVVRLVKWWARQRKDENPEFKCKSFLLELLVARMVDSGVQLNDYPRALAKFFSYIVKTGLEEQIIFNDYPSNTIPGYTGAAIEVFDPVNIQNNVTVRYSVNDREALVGAAEEAADSIREAFYATTKERAMESWQVILGQSFNGRQI